MAGWFPLTKTAGVLTLSQRSLFNVSYINDVAHYPFINHVLESDNWVSPNSTSFNAVSPTFPELLDQDSGYPNSATASGHQFGGGLKFPDSSKFNGPYVITWDGDGTLQINGGTWTESNNTGTTYTKNNNGVWTNVSGQTAYIVATASGLSGAPNIVGVYINATGGAGGYVRNVRIYRQADEADLLAGKVFRTAFKNQIKDHDPSCIRFMNYSGGNDTQGMRFENRVLPNYASYGINAGWVNSPLYGTTSGVNQYTLNSVTTGTRQTPASMTHGETVICRIGSAYSGGPSFGNTPVVASISKGATPRVVTTSAHGFSTGQKVIHTIPAGNGMSKLDRFPATITVINSTTYDITNFDSTSETTYVTNSAQVYVYVSLNVGLRGEYPIQHTSGSPGAGVYGDDGSGTYLKANDLKTFYFDKNVIGKSDGAGNYVKGAWLFVPDAGRQNGHWDGVPLEILTKLIVELNDMSPAKPISMWICYPHRGLYSIDPDHTTGSNWAIQATNIILNGNTVGSVTYPGLKTYPAVNLFIEYCNEIWNIGPAQGFYHNWYAFSRWGAGNKIDAHALRATAMARDIKNTYPSETQIKVFLGMWGATGMFPGDFAGNYDLWNGNSTPGNSGYYYTTDSVVVSGSWGAPKNWFDGVAIAPYVDAGNAYYSALGTGSFTDHSAMYSGTDNSGTLTMTGGTGGVSSTTLTITAVSAGSPVVNQRLVATGIDVPNSGTPATWITAVSGSSPNYTITLSRAATITNGSTIKSPSNSGGNYIGAADQSQAMTNFINAISSAPYTDGPGFAGWLDLQDQFISYMGAGQVVTHYEGGPNWDTPVGNHVNDYLTYNHIITAADSTFLTAAYNSTQLATAQTGFFNSISAKPKSVLPAIYLSVNVGQRWSFCVPDSYGATSTEGGGLTANPTWVALSTRNAGVA